MTDTSQYREASTNRMTSAEIFDDIYRRNVWGGSGGGSREAVAWPFASYVERLVRRGGISTIVDVGCGDSAVAKMICLPEGVFSLGCDISIEALYIGQHGCIGNALECDGIPRGDLALVKEVTQHLSNADVRLLIERLKQFPAVLHCSCLAPGPVDIETGGYRPVRLKDFGIHAQPILEWTFEGGIYHMELWRPRG